MFRRIVLVALPLLVGTALAGCDGHGHDPAKSVELSEHVTATGATVRLNPNPTAPSAAYFTLNGGANDAVLIGASSSDLVRAELHESRMDGGLMMMEPIARLPIPAGEQVMFRQGGKHVMLFGISDAARTRGNLTLNLDFADGPDASVVLAFPPQQAAQAAPPPPPLPPILVRPVIVPIPDHPMHDSADPAPDPAPAEVDHSTMDHGDHDH
ncbi:MAG: copper chaperone PCu(A)C [Sphingopyxis sp.]